MISDVFSVPWVNAKARGQTAMKLFKEVFKFNEVKVCTNLAKQQVIEELAKLEEKADIFEEEKLKGERFGVFAIGIVWIGHTLNTDIDKHNDILKRLRVTKPDPDYVQWYELTSLGEPICVNEYATSIASRPSTHVLHIDDF